MDFSFSYITITLNIIANYFQFSQNFCTIDDNILSTIAFDPNFGVIHYNEAAYDDVSPVEKSHCYVYDEVKISQAIISIEMLNGKLTKPYRVAARV